MKILYYDCFSGISGDMNLGAMIDLGIDKEYLLRELSKLGVDEYEISVTKDARKGITGTKVHVELKEHHHDHDHDHDHHHHRNLLDIKNIIDNSNLNENVKKISKKIFLKIAEAEAKVHGSTINDIHFHEVGAVDAIVDIVGAAICFDYLGVDKVLASNVEVGGGFVKCAHGILPVPAPAVVEILRGVPIKQGAVEFETTTPTGAAILTALTDEFTLRKEFSVSKIGYGIGHKDGEIPNVLRVYLGNLNERSEVSCTEEDNYMIECNIDDMNPELYDYIIEKLFAEGASDAYLTPIIMKKGRPAVKVSVLCHNGLVNKIEELLLNETTTLGCRRYKVEKSMLEREFSTLSTQYGEVKIKSSYYNGRVIKWKPEYEDCKKLAKENGIPINEIYNEVSKKWNKINE